MAKNIKKVLKITGYILGVLIIIRLSYPLLFPVYRIDTDSMEPTISSGDYIIASKFHYKFFIPERGDIVLFKPIAGIFNVGPWAHRIIAIKGDTVTIKDGLVTVNGGKILYPEINHEDLEIKIDDGQVFQKGDNKDTIAGIVPEDKIIGKVIFIFSNNKQT